MLEEIAPAVSPEHTLLSVAAGVTTSWMESHLPRRRTRRAAMPNTPSLVQEGIAAISPGRSATDVDLALAEEALGHLGQVVRLQEKDLDAVTAISGSGRRTSRCSPRR